MTISPRRAVGPVTAALLAVAMMSACSFRGSVSAATSSAPGSSGSVAQVSGAPTSDAAAGRTSSASTATGGASGGPTSANPGPTTVPSGTFPGRCHTSELTGSLAPDGAAAGQRYATLVLRSTGRRSCTVHGFGGLGLVGADGRALPTNQVRSGGPAATVLLAPGGGVRSELHWSTVTGPGEPPSGPCQPTPATVRVIPPDETDALSVAWNLGPVCSAGTIEQHPYTS